MGTQETIIYRLVMRNHSFGPYLPFSIFWALRGPKKGRGPTRTGMGLGPQNLTIKLAHWVDLLGQLLFRNHDFEIWRPEPPPLKSRTCKIKVRSPYYNIKLMLIVNGSLLYYSLQYYPNLKYQI